MGEGRGEGVGGGASECIDPIISAAPPLPLQLSGMASNLNMTHPVIWTLQIPASLLPLSGLCE